MKTNLLAISLLMAAGVYAQSPGGHRAPATPPTPAQMAQAETNRLTRFFNLTAAQQTTVLGILTTTDTQIQGFRAQIQPLQTALVTAIKANDASGISSTLMQISPLQEGVESAQAVAAGQIYATVLTAAQQAQIPNGLGPLMGQGGGVRGGRFR